MNRGAALPVELELKLKIDGSFQKDIARELESVLGVSGFEQADLTNTYYDTPSLDLHKSLVALRIREQGSLYIQTLKTKGNSINGLHQRIEWEWRIDRCALDLELLSRCSAWPLQVDVNTLAPIFNTNFLRKKADLKWGAANIELVIDKGVVNSNGKTLEIHEIELELKSGDKDCLIELGNKIQSSFPVRPSNTSKAQSGYQFYLQ
jgi:inorganic triphosphatase YgiF